MFSLYKNEFIGSMYFKDNFHLIERFSRFFQLHKWQNRLQWNYAPSNIHSASHPFENNVIYTAKKNVANGRLFIHFWFVNHLINWRSFDKRVTNNLIAPIQIYELLSCLHIVRSLSLVCMLFSKANILAPSYVFLASNEQAILTNDFGRHVQCEYFSFWEMNGCRLNRIPT